jgi:hypothetical protein
MFSTVDAPAARFLRIYLRSGRDQAQVILPPKLARMVAKVRAMPNHDRLVQLADTIGASEWVAVPLLSAVAYYKELSRALGDNPPPTTEATRSYQTRRDSADLRMLTMISRDSAQSRGLKTMSYQVVRIEVWRYRFSRNPPGLIADKISEVTRIAKGHGP